MPDSRVCRLVQRYFYELLGEVAGLAEVELVPVDREDCGFGASWQRWQRQRLDPSGRRAGAVNHKKRGLAAQSIRVASIRGTQHRPVDLGPGDTVARCPLTPPRHTPQMWHADGAGIRCHRVLRGLPCPRHHDRNDRLALAFPWLSRADPQTRCRLGRD